MTAQEEVEKVASDLATYAFEHDKDWKLPFVLARKLKRFSGEPEDYEKAVRLFCERTGESFEECFPAFIDAWHRVKFADTGLDTFALAAEQAKKNPVPLPGGLRAPTHAYTLIYTLCLELAVHTAPEPFVLPQPRVAAWTGLRKDTVSAIVRWLRRKGVIECVDETYVFGGRKSRAKKYRVLQ
jgi:hypothetical protein